MDKNLQAATEYYSENRVQVKFQYSYSSKHMAKLFLKKLQNLGKIQKTVV